MAFADPLVVTYPTGTNNNLPRTATSGRMSTYSLANGSIVASVKHEVRANGATASLLRVDFGKIAADPLVTTVNRKVQASVWVSVNRKTGEWTDAELLDMLKSLVTVLSANTYAQGIKLLGGES